MPKATKDQLKDIGFAAEQFGENAATDFDPYLGKVLARAEAAVKREVTAAAYDAAAGVQSGRLEEAELAWATAELYRRRTAVRDSDANIANTVSGYLALREYQNLADRYDEIFRHYVAQFRADGGPEPGASMGHVETGPYPKHSTTSIN